MIVFPKRHDLYVGKAILGTVLLAWAVLVGLDFVIGGLMGEIDDIGTEHYTFLVALTSILHTLPHRAYILFPTAAVIGSLLGLGQLAASSELTALRAFGLSRRRLSLAVAATLGLLTVLMVVNGETLSPWGQQRADQIELSAKSPNMIYARYYGLWAREGNTFLNAEGGEEHQQNGVNWLELHNVHLYKFDDDGRLQSITYARTAEHRDGEWLLREVRRTTFGPRSVTQTSARTQHWDSQFDDAALAASVSRPDHLTAAALHSGIEYRQRNGLDPGEYQEHYWGRWFYPVSVLALCLAAIPFAFGTLRSGSLGKRLFIGIVFALGFWLLQTQAVKLAGVYKFDYRIAYLVPPLLMLAISAMLFRRRSG